MNEDDHAARAIEQFLRALGYAIEGDLVGTGERVASAWREELVAGERRDPVQLLRDGSLDLGEGPHAVVILRGVSVATMCPHHLLPGHGVATIGYQPRRRAAGLGTIVQAVEACARRLVLQETLSRSITESLQEGLQAEGTFCRLRLQHACLSLRGERQTHADVETTSFSGVFQGAERASAIALLGESTR